MSRKWIYARRLHKEAKWPTGVAATRILYLHEEAVLRKKQVLIERLQR